MQLTAAGQRNSAHPWIMAEIIAEFLTQGENREDSGGMRSQHILSCVCAAQPYKGTPHANVASQGPPWGCLGPATRATRDSLFWQDLEVPSPTTETRTPLRTGFEKKLQDGGTQGKKGPFLVSGGSKDGVTRLVAVARALPPALG